MDAKKLGSNMASFWNSTGARNAHLGLDGEAEMLLARARAMVSDRVKVKGKRVIDYGHGGGYLGLHLLADCDVAYYIGYDIAERSNKRATELLAGFDNKELILLKEHRWSFAEKQPDVIVCLACIFHFPTRVYLDNFLKTCNESGAKDLVLEIRNRGNGTRFQPDPYSVASPALQKRTCLTCETDPGYVGARLPAYKLVDKTEPEEAPTRCQILWYKRR